MNGNSNHLAQTEFAHPSAGGELKDVNLPLTIYH